MCVCVCSSTVVQIFGYSAIFCLPILIPIAATSRNNAVTFQIDPNQTYEGFDNLAMGNVEVSWHMRFTFETQQCHLISIQVKETRHKKCKVETFVVSFMPPIITSIRSSMVTRVTKESCKNQNFNSLSMFRIHTVFPSLLMIVPVRLFLVDRKKPLNSGHFFWARFGCP